MLFDLEFDLFDLDLVVFGWPFDPAVELTLIRSSLLIVCTAALYSVSVCVCVCACGVCVVCLCVRVGFVWCVCVSVCVYVCDCSLNELLTVVDLCYVSSGFLTRRLMRRVFVVEHSIELLLFWVFCHCCMPRCLCLKLAALTHILLTTTALCKLLSIACVMADLSYAVATLWLKINNLVHTVHCNLHVEFSCFQFVFFVSILACISLYLLSNACLYYGCQINTLTNALTH